MKKDIIVNIQDDFGNECQIAVPKILSVTTKYSDFSSTYKLTILYEGNKQVLYFKEREGVELAANDISHLVAEFHESVKNS